MDEIILRFPLMAEQIFEELDDQNLTKCRGISNIWYDATERIQWTRRIQNLTKENRNHQSSWKLVLAKIPTEILNLHCILLQVVVTYSFYSTFMGTLKSVCSSWFALISSDKYEHTHLRVPI